MSGITSACDRIAENLEHLVAGAAPEALTGEARRQIEAHLEHCAPCRTLVALAQDDPATDGVAAGSSMAAVTAMTPAGLADGILARTTGTACRQATGLLCDLTDERLAPADTELLRLHLHTCRGCDTLSTALRRLAGTLPHLAEMQPDERFVDDVLARTLPLAARLRRFAARLSERWAALVQQPRFSWEAAYIGAVMLSLLFGAPASPLRHVPRQALALVQANPISSLAADGHTARISETLSNAGSALWNWTARPVGETLSDLGQNLNERYGRTAEARARLHVHTTELGRATVRIESTDGLDALLDMGNDIKVIWNEFTSENADEETQPQTINHPENNHE